MDKRGSQAYSFRVRIVSGQNWFALICASTHEGWWATVVRLRISEQSIRVKAPAIAVSRVRSEEFTQ